MKKEKGRHTICQQQQHRKSQEIKHGIWSIPTTVPFTLQTCAVFLAVGVLGGKRGTLSILIYLLLGAIGVPVFAGFTGGIGIVLGTTGGYIIGFLFSGLIMWAMEQLLGKKT